MLGQVDIGTLAQRRTNGWQMVGPTLAHRRPNIGMFMGFMCMCITLYLSRIMEHLHIHGEGVSWVQSRFVP